MWSIVLLTGCENNGYVVSAVKATDTIAMKIAKASALNCIHSCKLMQTITYVHTSWSKKRTCTPAVTTSWVDVTSTLLFIWNWSRTAVLYEHSIVMHRKTELVPIILRATDVSLVRRRRLYTSSKFHFSYEYVCCYVASISHHYWGCNMNCPLFLPF
jgi:hypothetical protein